MPPEDFYQLIFELPKDRFRHTPSFVGMQYTDDLIILDVTFIQGRPKETRLALLKDKEIAFRQWSDKGYIHCRVTIPIATCNHCDTRYSPDPEIDKILDEAFQREYEKR